MKANDLRPGAALKMDNKLFVVHTFEHRTPGNLRAFVQVKLKDVTTGQIIERRLNPADEMESINLDRREMEYLYSDNDGATFMDSETFDQIIIQPEILGNALLYLAPNAKAVVLMNEGNPILVELPSAVDVTIVDTPPGIKGATATNQLKEATCDTGLKTRVPPFIVTGEMIRVSTADGSYMSRVKSE